MHIDSSAFNWCVKPKSTNFSNTSKQTRSASSMSVLTFVQPTLWFCCQVNSKAHKVGQVFPYTACNNHSCLLFSLWTDPFWSWCYSLEKFKYRGWCVVLSAVHKVFGWPKFPQLREWMNFPHATLCVWISEMMAKSFWCHYDITNLTQDYRKEKEQSKETMALEVVTGGKNNKIEKND